MQTRVHMPILVPLMNLRYLQAFLALCDQGSIECAAQRTGRAKSAISRSVNELERALATELFDRDGHRMTCNAFGRALRFRAAQAMDEFRSGLLSLSETAQPGGRYVHVPSDLFHEARLEAFIALTETEDLRLAALKLGLTPACVTRASNALGRKLGLALFLRNDNSMSPTAPARRLAMHARRALEALRQIAPDLAALRQAA